MSFLTELCQDHHQIVVAEIVKCLSLSESVLTSLPPAPGGTQRGVVQVAGYWLPIGEENPVGDEKYILTPSVKRNLHNLSRVVSARYVWFVSCLFKVYWRLFCTESTQCCCRAQHQLGRQVL